MALISRKTILELLARQPWLWPQEIVRLLDGDSKSVSKRHRTKCILNDLVREGKLTKRWGADHSKPSRYALVPPLPGQSKSTPDDENLQKNEEK